MGRVGLEPTPDQGGRGLFVRWRCHERSEHRHQIWVEHHVIDHDPVIGEAVERDRSDRRGVPVRESDGVVEPGDRGVSVGHQILILGCCDA